MSFFVVWGNNLGQIRCEECISVKPDPKPAADPNGSSNMFL